MRPQRKSRKHPRPPTSARPSQQLRLALASTPDSATLRKHCSTQVTVKTQCTAYDDKTRSYERRPTRIVER